MVTPPSCAHGNVHTLSSHKRPSLEYDLVLCDVPSHIWAWVLWVLEEVSGMLNLTVHITSEQFLSV